MTIEMKIQIKHEEVDKMYTIPSYMGNNVKWGIKEAILRIEREEKVISNS